MSTVVKRHSRGILLQDKGDCSDQVHSDQMVLRTVRWEAGPLKRRPKGYLELLETNSRGTIRLESTQIRCSCDGQVSGWTSPGVAKDAQSRKPRDLVGKICIVTVPDLDGGRPKQINAWFLYTHMVYL